MVGQLKTRSPTDRSTFLDYTLLIILISISLFLLVTGTYYVSSRWVLTTGKVVYNQDLICTPLSNGSTLYDCSFTVRYKATRADGSLQFYYTKVENVIGPKINRNDTVYIQYDPQDPSSAIYGNTSYRTFGLLYLSLGAFTTLLTTYYWLGLTNKKILK